MSLPPSIVWKWSGWRGLDAREELGQVPAHRLRGLHGHEVDDPHEALGVDEHLLAKRAEAPILGTFYMCFEGF